MSGSVELLHVTLPSDRDGGALVYQFDIYLRILENAYLGFFRERTKIEEVYIDSLRKLHRKAKGIDPFFDPSVRTCTMKAAWDKVRDSLEREAQIRQEFLTTLADEIISPLTALKESQSRTRERVRYDLKESAAAHADSYRKIPRLKEAYKKKSQELREFDPPPSLRPSNDAVSSSQSRFDLSFASDVSSTLSPRLHNHSRHSLLGVSLRRMPSTSSSITEITRQLIGGIRGSNRNSDIVPRSLLVREVVDQADKEYRGAIHQLETLRLRKISTLERARKSLEGIVLEGTESAKELLLRYVTVIIKACTTHSEVATDIQPVIENVSAENDSSILSASLQHSLAPSIPRPIFYDNYYVGECPDLVFGRKLVDHAMAKGNEDNVPKILRVCIEEVNRRGLEAAGIYRVPGRDARVKELQGRFERSERTFSFNRQRDDIHSIASLLKRFLGELPEPLFRFPLQDRIRESEKLGDDIARISLLRSKIRELPTIHRVSLRALVEHLACVASHARKNKMDAKSLAAVFGLVVFGEDEIPRGDPQKLWSKDYVMEILIKSADSVFEKGLPARPTGSVPGGSLTLQTSVSIRQTEGAQAAGSDPNWNRRSTITSLSSSSLSCPPMSPSCSSADSLGSPAATQSPVLSELPNFNISALHLCSGATDQPKLQQKRASVADARDTVVLHARELNRSSQVFLPSRLSSLPEQQEERKRQLEASLAYIPMSPQTVSSYDPGTTVGSLMSPPAMGGTPFSP